MRREYEAEGGSVRPKPKIEELRMRFWSRVKRGPECWMWLGTKQSMGYGAFYFHGKPITAHRVAFQLENPSIAIDGMDICHHCDNRMCVRPEHLFVGTRKDNMVDMINKGRGCCGEKNHQSKLRNDQIAAIRVDGRLQKTIAADYGVDRAVISRIKNGKAYVTA